MELFKSFGNQPFAFSSSMGCFKAVISLKVQRIKITWSFSFLIGAIFNSSHSGDPENRIKYTTVNSGISVEVHPKLLIHQSKFSGPRKIYFDISVV